VKSVIRVNLSTKRTTATFIVIGKFGLFSLVFFSGFIQNLKIINLKNVLILQHIQLQLFTKKIQKKKFLLNFFRFFVAMNDDFAIRLLERVKI